VKWEICQYLKDTKVIGREILYFEELDSTNTYAKSLAMEGAESGLVIMADHQTAGRGRMERSFQSPRGKGLYLSVLLRPDLPPERLMPVTALAGVAVCEAVEEVCGVRPGLKWPNDPVLGGKKICGILTELVGNPADGLHLILGIGINVKQTAGDFSPDVAEMAASLEMTLGKSVSRPQLAAVLLEKLDRMYTALEQGILDDYYEAYRKDCVNLGKTVQLIGFESRENVTAVDIDALFGLVIRTAEGAEKTVRSGEVSVRGLYGYVE